MQHFVPQPGALWINLGSWTVTLGCYIVGWKGIKPILYKYYNQYKHTYWRNSNN